MDTVDIQAVESKLSDVTVTAIPMSLTVKPSPSQQVVSNGASTTTSGSPSPQGSNLSKYAQLLNVIEEMGREVRPTYAGSRSSTERLKRSIVSARILESRFDFFDPGIGTALTNQLEDHYCCCLTT